MESTNSRLPLTVEDFFIRMRSSSVISQRILCLSTLSCASSFTAVNNQSIGDCYLTYQTIPYHFDSPHSPMTNYLMLISTIRYPYPLPLVPPALEQLRVACIFIKLALRNDYNLTRIPEEDTQKRLTTTWEIMSSYLLNYDMGNQEVLSIKHQSANHSRS